MDTQEGDWQDIIGRRLIKLTHEADETLVKKNIEIESRDTGEGENTGAIEVAAEETKPGSVVAADDVEIAPTSFAKVEKSLISLGFFTPSSRRIKDQKIKKVSFTREIDGKRVEATAEFHPSAMLGLPITADQDKYLALHDIITNLLQTEGKITNPIRFTSADLLRLLNKRVRTGKNYKDIYEWLDVMTATTIMSNGVVYEAGKQRFARDRFHVFERAVSVGKEMPDGTIADANYVWLSEWQLENINQNYLLPIDLVTYRELKNHITKALVPLLQIWLFATDRKKPFEKRYDAICEMLSLQVYRTPSEILRQLKPSLDELVQHQYLEEWRIEKTSDRKAYKIIFVHGPKFHRDRRKRLDQKAHTETSILIAQSEPLEPGLLEPGKPESVPAAPTPARTETNRRTQRRDAPIDVKPEPEKQSQRGEQPPEGMDEKSILIDELCARGLMPSVTIKLLSAYSPEQFDRVRDYLEFFDAAKNVGPGFLHELIKNGDPLPATFVSSRDRRARKREDDRQRNRLLIKETLTTRYEDYQQKAIDRFIAEQMTVEEFERRVEVRRKEDEQQTDLWSRQLSSQLKLQIARGSVRTDIKKDVQMLSFEEFRRRELPLLIAELNFNPEELGITIDRNTVTGEQNSTAPNGASIQ